MKRQNTRLLFQTVTGYRPGMVIRMNLGVDFGSTYSSFAKYNAASSTVELCKPTHSESEAVPSIACLDEDDNIITGHEARAQVLEDADTVSFEAFKMLLTETNAEILRKRGYTDQYTPWLITERFLDQQINKILSNSNESVIDQLVICAPEIWTTKESINRGMLDGRFILKDICKRIDGVKEVEVVSEPTAASAYFAHYYHKLTGKRMTGNVLIIDYGGGTLDLTLTSVSLGKGGNSVEIEVKNRTGVGENHPGKIGDAGIAYMEEIVRLAVADCREAGVEDPGAVSPRDPDFRRAYNNLERKIKSQVAVSSNRNGSAEVNFRLYNAIQDCIDDISRMKDNHDCFTTIKYGKAKVNVTFSHLILAYDKMIRGKLDQCLRDMTEYMDEAGIDYQSSNSDSFHVVVVGGFGKFMFVQNQIQEFFDFSSTGDKRFAYDLGESREYAVAMGAALLADKVISIRHTAPYAIGIISRLADNTPICNFAIKYRQEIDEGTDYWISGPDGPKKFINANGRVQRLLIGYDMKGQQKNELVIKPELANLIKAAYEKLFQEYAAAYPDSSGLGLEHNLGFQMDNSEIVTLLIRSVRTNTTERIVLKSYQDMFELTEV